MGWKIGDKITVDPGDNDLVPLQQGDNTRNSTLARIKKFLLGDEKLKTTAQTITGAINENTAQLSEKSQEINNLSTLKADNIDTNRTTNAKDITGSVNELNANKAEKTEINYLDSNKASTVYVDNKINQIQQVIINYNGSLANLISDTTVDVNKNYLILDSSDTTNYGFVCCHNGTTWTAGWKFQNLGMGENNVKKENILLVNEGLLSVQWENGYIASKNNTFYPEGTVTIDYGSNQYRRTKPIRLNKGEMLVVRAYANANINIISQVNYGSVYTKAIAVYNAFLKSYTVLCESDYAYYIVCNEDANYTPEIYIYTQNKNIDNALIKYSDGYLSSSNGAETASSGYYTSDMLPLLPQQTIHANLMVSSGAYAITIYNTALEKINSVNGLDGANRIWYRYYNNSNNIVFIRITNTVTSISDVKIEYISKTNLSGKVLNMIGDSYVKGQTVQESYVAYGLVAYRNGMTYNNYGINGDCLVADGGTGTKILDRYSQMVDADYIGVCCGRNDYNQNIPIGSITDVGVNTFYGGLNTLFSGLIQKYCGKKIFVVTQWAVNDSFQPYVDAVRNSAHRWGIPVIDSNRFAGIYARSDSFKTKYFLSSTDVSHLNIDGHALYATWLEKQILLL